MFPISWEKINDVWYNYVKGHNPKDYFGIYDVVRMEPCGSTRRDAIVPLRRLGALPRGPAGLARTPFLSQKRGQR